MSVYQSRSLSNMFLKNSIILLLPGIIYLIFIITLGTYFPIFDKVITCKVSNIEEIEKQYNSGVCNVSIYIKRATYTGYDYYENNELVGSYYYTFLDDKGLFLLIKGKRPKEIIENYNITGKIIANNPNVEYVINQFSKDIKISNDELLNIMYNGIISENDYPYAYIILVFSVILMPICLTVFGIVANIIYIMQPQKHPKARMLLSFGSSKSQVIDEINSQIRHRFLYRTKYAIITQEYIIFHTMLLTDVIRLSDIRFVSSHIANKRHLFNKRSYKLIISNSERILFEHIFNNYEEVNKVRGYLYGLCSELDKNNT